MLFPDGHLPTHRWRGWAWFTGIGFATLTLMIMLAPGEAENALVPGLENPLGVEALRHVEFLLWGAVLAVPLYMVGCATALVRRFRHSRGGQRQQLKWLAAAAAAVALVYGTALIVSVPYGWTESASGPGAPPWLGLLQNTALLSFILIPVAVGIAILRHGLYDIDRLINRVLVYGAVSALLTVVYVAGVVAASVVLRGVTGQRPGAAAVAVSTLMVAALFRPLRGHVQRVIDRRFYRRRYDAKKAVETFAASLRHEVDLAALTDDLRTVLGETVQPSGVLVWLGHGSLRHD